MEPPHDEVELFPRAVDVQSRERCVRREEEREAVLPHVDVGVAMRIGAGHVHAGKKNGGGCHAAMMRLIVPTSMYSIAHAPARDGGANRLHRYLNDLR